MAQTNHRIRVDSLLVSPIPKASAQQSAGRIRPGLWTSDFGKHVTEALGCNRQIFPFVYMRGSPNSLHLSS